MEGEKWGFQRTDVMREFPLPEIEGYAGLMPSSIAWNAIAREYKTRYVNETLKTWSQDQGTSLSLPADRTVDVPGELIATRSTLNSSLRWFRYDPWALYIQSVFYARNGFHSGMSLREQVSTLTSLPSRMLWLAWRSRIRALPCGAERIGASVAQTTTAQARLGLASSDTRLGPGLRRRIDGRVDPRRQAVSSRDPAGPDMTSRLDAQPPAIYEAISDVQAVLAADDALAYR